MVFQKSDHLENLSAYSLINNERKELLTSSLNQYVYQFEMDPIHIISRRDSAD